MVADGQRRGAVAVVKKCFAPKLPRLLLEVLEIRKTTTKVLGECASCKGHSPMALGWLLPFVGIGGDGAFLAFLIACRFI